MTVAKNDESSLAYLQFAAILLWGYQTELLAFAIPIAVILEARFYLNRRWALTKQDFYRTADLTSIGFVGLVVFLFTNRVEYHFITVLTQWLPIVFFPLVAVVAYSTTERMPLDVLFYSLRRQKEPVTQSWDMNYIYFGMCLVSAGTNTAGGNFYLLACGLLILGAFYRLRSTRYAVNVWILTACIVFLSGILAQQAIRTGHLALKQQTREWLANYIRNRTNILKTKSAIGIMGRLKLSDEILFRVEPLTLRPPSLLQEATYNIPDRNNWMILNPQFAPVPHEDDFEWRLAGQASDTEQRARIYLEFKREIGIVPIPGSVTGIKDLPALNISKSAYGSIQAQGLVPSPGYEVSYRPGANINSPPGGGDLMVPGEYKDMLATLVAGSNVSPADPIKVIHRIFDGYRYSLLQGSDNDVDPIEHFLTTSRQGHCEYFASATVMLLRELGIPARYAVGYAVQEYNETLGMFIVRERHAHAWAIAYLNGGWQVVDTTPQIWAESEAAGSSFLRPVYDLFSNGVFLFQRWWSKTKLSDYEVELYVLGGILALILIWRIATSEQVIINRDDSDDRDGAVGWQGLGSAFFRIEAYLAGQGFAREKGEPFNAWLGRIGHTDLRSLLELHNRLRFDPTGLGHAEAVQLETGVRDWIEARPAEEQSDQV